MQLAATAIEIGIELKPTSKDSKAAGGRLKYYTTKKQGLMDFVQMLGALGGMSFGQIFKEITTTPEDMPRSCAETLKIDRELSGQMEELVQEGINLAMANETLQIIKAGGQAAAGNEVNLPAGEGEGEEAPPGAEEGGEAE